MQRVRSDQPPSNLSAFPFSEVVEPPLKMARLELVEAVVEDEGIPLAHLGAQSPLVVDSESD